MPLPYHTRSSCRRSKPLGRESRLRYATKWQRSRDDVERGQRRSRAGVEQRSSHGARLRRLRMSVHPGAGAGHRAACDDGANSFRYVFRYFPLREIHPHAELAAEAAETVYTLGGPEVFWVMHDALFANQDDLEPPSLERQATAAGVASKPFRAALKAQRFATRIQRDVRSGLANGVDGTPSVFINGERYL